LGPRRRGRAHGGRARARRRELQPALRRAPARPAVRQRDPQRHPRRGGGGIDAHLQELIVGRLAADEGLDEDAIGLVLAATDGRAQLDAALAGEAEPRTAELVQPELEIRPPGAYLSQISVQGFRGVGEPAALKLEPGPGLVLVVGRNGSGKSSFAEGLELLMTGANLRWEKRTQVWKEGWQNLHFGGETVLSAEFQVEDGEGPLTLERRWPHGAKIGPAECAGLDEPGWPAALARYRPFLSYSELGAMFDELKTMYDALAAILGLEDIEVLQKTLRDARLERERGQKGVRDEAKRMLEQFAGVEDDRATVVAEALKARPIDFEAIELALVGAGYEGDPGAELGTLRALCTLRVPEDTAIDAALDALTVARDELAALAGTDAAHAASLVALLETALRHDERHQEADCPVCGTEGVIDERWRAQTAQEVGRLAAAARGVEDAQRKVTAAQQRVADLLPPVPPPVVGRARDLDLDPGKLEQAWEQWAQARVRAGDPEAEALLRATLAGVQTATGVLSAAAEEELDRREDVWRPVAKRLGEWVPGARRALAAAARLEPLKAAEAWARDAGAELQKQRLEPIAGAAKKNWEVLRQESNVTLDGFHLRKSGNTRQAEVDVKVDGTGASAFGVMSQGELHALAVSVFLPRAGLAESPFRFMVIDDPVQSMDPAKVDGLAMVLAGAAKTRQVIVFTHDERLPEAVRRLNIEATVLGVTRRPLSKVTVKPVTDPVNQYTEDARALLKEPSLPEEVARRVVPGFCRHAIEAACATAVRRRRLGRGDRHVEVEAALGGAKRLYSQLSLALYDNPDQGGDVLGKIHSKWGAKRVEAVKAANAGTHEELAVDLHDLVTHSAVLARELADVK
jgi:energy-coupling factor transporter ATP-binding protein EcfA2